MLGELRANHPELLDAIRTSKEVTPEADKTLIEFLDGFLRTFV